MSKPNVDACGSLYFKVRFHKYLVEIRKCPRDLFSILRSGAVSGRILSAAWVGRRESKAAHRAQMCSCPVVVKTASNVQGTFQILTRPGGHTYAKYANSNHLNVQLLASLDGLILQAGLNQSRNDLIYGEYLRRLLCYDDCWRWGARNCHYSNPARARVSGEVCEPCQASCYCVKYYRSAIWVMKFGSNSWSIVSQGSRVMRLKYVLCCDVYTH